jgi:hypothetical protein
MFKKTKYFSVELDCAQDESTRQQLTLIIRIVEICDKPEVQINKYCIVFIHINSNI